MKCGVLIRWHAEEGEVAPEEIRVNSSTFDTPVPPTDEPVRNDPPIPPAEPAKPLMEGTPRGGLRRLPAQVLPPLKPRMSESP
jgi:hypothetical protein